MTPEQIKKMQDGRKNTAHEKVTHTVRTMDGGTKTFNNYIRSQAIKMMCVSCLGWGDHPSTCTDTLCPLYPFRGGTEKTRRGE